MHDLIRTCSRKGWLRFCALSGLVLLALLPRLSEMRKALTYDEIFTLNAFATRPAGEILHDVALPNNHPLNTLLVKALYQEGAPVWRIRIPALTAGVLAVLAWGSVMLAWRGRAASLWTMWLLSFSAPLVIYSQLARGYSLQIAFLGFFFCGLAWYGKRGSRRTGSRILCGILMISGAVGATLSLCSSAMYLAAGSLAWLLLRKKSRQFPWLPFLLSAVPVLSYLLWCLPELRTAQTWGEPVAFPELPRFVFSRLKMLVFLPGVLFAFAGCFLAPRKVLPLLLPVLLPLGAAVITRGGPARVYLPCLIPLGMAAAIGADRLLHRIARQNKPRLTHLVRGLLALMILWEFMVLRPCWQAANWGRILATVRQQVPHDTLVIFPATGGLELKYGFHDAAMEDYFLRLLHPEHSGLLMLGTARGINGSDRNYSETVLSTAGVGLPVAQNGFQGWFYSLEELTTPPASGEIIIAVLPPVPLEESRTIRRRAFAPEQKVLRLNPWLNVTLETEKGTLSGGLFAIRFDESGEFWQKRMAEKSEKIRFYRLR